MKLHRIVALTVATGWLAACTPSTEDLCNHMMDLAMKEAGDAKDAKMSDEDKKKGMEACIKGADEEKKKIGEDKFKEQAKCVMAATKMEDVAKCDKEEKKEDKKEEKAQ